MRVVLGLITRVDHALGLALIGSLQALLPAGFDILDVVSTPASAEQTEAVFHFLTHVDEPTAAG